MRKTVGLSAAQCERIRPQDRVRGLCCLLNRRTEGGRLPQTLQDLGLPSAKLFSERAFEASSDSFFRRSANQRNQHDVLWTSTMHMLFSHKLYLDSVCPVSYSLRSSILVTRIGHISRNRPGDIRRKIATYSHEHDCSQYLRRWTFQFASMDFLMNLTCSHSWVGGMTRWRSQTSEKTPQSPGEWAGTIRRVLVLLAMRRAPRPSAGSTL